ncbi:MAG: DUF5723 family protein [Prevotellaceae bacterium]|jgi:hypothetical protein|nr:DUF5723 family protein [Prevotellaceae bacterium]
MKKRITLVLLGCLAASLWMPVTMQAQYLRTSYFMDGTSARYYLNPALSPRRGYINLPAIGSVLPEVSSNSLGIQDVIDIVQSGTDFLNSPLFIDKLADMNRVNVNAKIDILGIGWHRGNNFWSATIGARMDVDADIPKSMFEVIRQMNQDNFVWSPTQQFNVENQRIRLNSYVEVALGYSRSIGKHVTIGVRPKLLLGAANLDLQINRLHIQGVVDGMNSSFDLQTDAYMRASFKGLELDRDHDNYVTDLDLDGEHGIAGYGAGVDLGIGLQLFDHLNLSASLLDLGFINWSKESTRVAQSQKDIHIDKDNYSPDMFDFGLYGLKGLDANEFDAHRSRLSPTLVLGGEYALFRNKLGVGVLSTTRFGELYNYSELTVAASWRPNTLINASLSYSLLEGNDTFGLALKLGPLMVGTDYMFFGKNSKHVNAYVGLSIPLGKKKTD